MGMAIKELLLIEEPTVLILKDELMKVAGWFVLPSFVIALCLEYFGELKFGEVVKKLILILSFIGCFYTFHTKAVELSFQGSEEILKKVSPRNVFLKNWMDIKVRTKTSENWSMLEKFAIPNVNDLIGTFFFVVSKLFIWILKLVFTTVYHLTYVFAPLTAILYFFPITKSSIGGTIQSSLWCIFMPFVLVSILAIVGNSIQAPASSGNLSIVTIDQILWLFGVTLLLLMSPVLTLGILRGGGVAMSGSAIGAIMSSTALKVVSSATPVLKGGVSSMAKKGASLGSQRLFEPSVKKLLQKELSNSPENKNRELLSKGGGFKNPFSAPKKLNERLEAIGISKDEALKLSNLPRSNFGKTDVNKTYQSKNNSSSHSMNKDLSEISKVKNKSQHFDTKGISNQSDNKQSVSKSSQKGYLPITKIERPVSSNKVISKGFSQASNIKPKNPSSLISKANAKRGLNEI